MNYEGIITQAKSFYKEADIAEDFFVTHSTHTSPSSGPGGKYFFGRVNIVTWSTYEGFKVIHSENPEFIRIVLNHLCQLKTLVSGGKQKDD